MLNDYDSVFVTDRGHLDSYTRHDTASNRSPKLNLNDTIKVTNSFLNTRQTNLYVRSPETTITPKILHQHQTSISTRSNALSYRLQSSVLSDQEEKKRVKNIALEQISKLVPKKPKRINEISERFQRLHDRIPKTLEEEILDETSIFQKKKDVKTI